MLELTFDLLLCCFLLGLVWKVLTVGQLYQAAIFFIAFGLGMALAWARLAAPDVALAEATIGAGLLGVLLIDSLRVFAPSAEADNATRQRRLSDALKGGGPITRAAVLLIGATATLALLLAIWTIPAGGGLTQAVADAMPDSGVDHPVTAVLLNFRGYDTWLEVGVLLLAMMGLLVVRGDSSPIEVSSSRPDALLDWLTRALVPLLILTAGYLLWLGKFAPGGAFQAGVLLGAAVILLRLNGFASLERLPPAVWRVSLVLGFAAFLLHGIGALLAGRHFLEYPAAHAGHWILGLEALAAFSIAFTLAAFFIGLHASDRSQAATAQPLEQES